MLELKKPIITNPRIHSHRFWEKTGFYEAQYEIEGDLDENPHIWLPVILISLFRILLIKDMNLVAHSCLLTV
ncbi:hypothetical protein [Oceanobacillus arenosus]|uniref:hypothetical protein n=1 Tax=Oceanobacillus arenosus TaxID=1229153 RepID=UPI00268751B4